MVGILRLELEREGNYEEEEEMICKSTERFHSTHACENSPANPGGVRLRAEKVRWGESPGGFESLAECRFQLWTTENW